jgi:hypothetical protein
VKPWIVPNIAEEYTMTDINNFESNGDSAKQKMTAIRREILEALRALGTFSILMHYEFYEEDVEENKKTVRIIDISPPGIILPEDLEERLRNFGFLFAYYLNSGCDEDYGAHGTLTWDLNTDSLKVDHHQYYLACETTHYEGL